MFVHKMHEDKNFNSTGQIFILIYKLLILYLERLKI